MIVQQYRKVRMVFSRSQSGFYVPIGPGRLFLQQDGSKAQVCCWFECAEDAEQAIDLYLEAREA
jgi:hypothetical protein